MSDQPFVFLNEVEQMFLVKNQLNPKRSLVLQNNPKCNIIFYKFLKAPRVWTNGIKVVGFLASDQALKSPPTNERLECINEQEDVIDDTLKDEDEEEMGGTMSLNRNKLHELI